MPISARPPLVREKYSDSTGDMVFTDPLPNPVSHPPKINGGDGSSSPHLPIEKIHT